MNELHLFAGSGGGILAGQMLGHRCVCAVEWEPYAQAVLVARQNDGSFPPFPIWDDVQTFDGRPWRGVVDIVAGGFPCQDISVAGKGAGIDGARSGMWGHMARIVGEVRPRYVFVENSPALITRGLGRVLGDVAALGYDCRWTVLGAADVGAPHQRDRFWLVASDTERERTAAGTQGQARRALPDSDGDCQASQCKRDDVKPWAGCKCASLAHADGVRQLQPKGCQRNEWRWSGDCGTHVADASSTRRQRNERAERGTEERADIGSAGWWQSEPDVGRMAHGVAHRAHRLKAIGNGQVPLCAATAWRMLSDTNQPKGEDE